MSPRYATCVASPTPVSDSTNPSTSQLTQPPYRRGREPPRDATHESLLATRSYQPARDATQPVASRRARASAAPPNDSPLRSTTCSSELGCQPSASSTG